MRAPTPSQLLGLWERSGDEAPAAYALALLGLACEDLDAEALAALPVGRRDARLIELRTLLFGDAFAGLAACPRCGTTVEAVFRAADLLAAAPTSSTAGAHEFRIGGCDVRFRLPDSNDLLALAAEHDSVSARALLLARCIVAATCGGEPCAVDELSPETVEGLEQAMALADPLADTQIAVNCPACGHAWNAWFDAAGFLAQELGAWAQRTLRDVDTLARAYHWREADILALGPRRRQAYLELCAP